MNWIYKLNWWYDDLEQTNPALRFFLFIVPIGILQWFILGPEVRTSIIAGFILLLMVILRVIPLMFKRQRNG